MKLWAPNVVTVGGIMQYQGGRFHREREQHRERRRPWRWPTESARERRARRAAARARVRPPMLDWKPCVVVVGHSFIGDVRNRFNHMAQEDGKAINKNTFADFFNLGDLVDGVEFVVIYSGEEKQHGPALAKAVGLQPDICVVQLGANELADPSVAPLQAAFDVLEMGRLLRERCGARVCVFMSCIKRVNGHPYSEWGWWQRQTEFNRAIQEECAVVPGFEFEGQRLYL